VPLFPYPGSPEYTRRWGQPDERAWERAHEHYLGLFTEFSDIQERRPSSLVELEAALRHE
jgi:anaerobic magnesium-protoporphyrin IX monomethyl ester cyclase